MFYFDDLDDQELLDSAQKLRENYNVEDSLKLDEEIRRRIDRLEWEFGYDISGYPHRWEIENRISKLEKLRDRLYRL